MKKLFIAFILIGLVGCGKKEDPKPDCSPNGFETPTGCPIPELFTVNVSCPSCKLEVLNNGTWSTTQIIKSGSASIAYGRDGFLTFVVTQNESAPFVNIQVRKKQGELNPRFRADRLDLVKGNMEEFKIK